VVEPERRFDTHVRRASEAWPRPTKDGVRLPQRAPRGQLDARPESKHLARAGGPMLRGLAGPFALRREEDTGHGSSKEPSGGRLVKDTLAEGAFLLNRLHYS